MTTTRHRLDEELTTLRCEAATMLTMTGTMLRQALEALRTQEPTLSADVLAADDRIDAQDQEIEIACLRLIALQQPVVASDLRLVSAVLKAVDDIERIGDHAVNIARTAERMASQKVAYQPEVAGDLPLLSAKVLAMLETTVVALSSGGQAMSGYPRHAGEIIAMDDEIDVLYAELRREWQSRMRQNPGEALLLSYLLFVAHYLERVGDHCKNVAERILFYQTGRERRPIK